MDTLNKTHSEECIWRINLKNEWDIYISFIYRTISFHRQLLKIPCKLCTPLPLEIRGLSHGALLTLALKTSLDTNLVNIFHWAREICPLSLTNLWYLSLQFQISITYFYSWRISFFKPCLKEAIDAAVFMFKFNLLQIFRSRNDIFYALHLFCNLVL